MSGGAVLVLGGTTEAHALAERLAEAQIPAIVSLAGKVKADYPPPLRQGGFGGVEGLAEYLQAENIAALIDATHPFAAQMPHNAAQAALAKNTPFAMLKRPEWSPYPGQNWQSVPDLATALAQLPAQAHAFLALGASALPATKLRPDCRFTLRAMTALDGPLPPHVSYCQSRPGSEAEEGIFLRKQGFTHLIAKNSGGPSRGKIDAAQKLGLPITMISRPPLPKGPIFQRVEDILAWLAPHLSATKGRA